MAKKPAAATGKSIFAACGVFLFLREIPGPWTIAGAALVLGAMIALGLLGLRGRNR